MPLTGIANENEFYSAYYLDAILKEDLKGVAQRWKEQTEEQTPDRQLGSLWQDYFKLRERQRVRDEAEQRSLQQEFFRQVLEILGYEWNPQLQVLDDDSLLPIVAEVKRSNGMPQLWVIEGFNLSAEPMDVLSLSVPPSSPQPPSPQGEGGAGSDLSPSPSGRGARGEGLQRTPLEQKDKIYLQEKLSEGVANASAYRRLKLVMDYWCALWFWRIADADQLPSREEFLQEIGAILGETEMLAPAEQQMQLFPETQEQTQGKLFLSTWGYVDLKKLKLFYPRLQVVEQIAELYHFFHWELEFADIFLQRGGFVLMVGNPPWIKVEWSEGGVLGDADPLVVLRNLSASVLAQKREQAFEGNSRLRQMYLLEYEDAAGTQNFLNAIQNYPLLAGQKANLFKCFLPQAWLFSNSKGISGFLHPEGVYDDPNGGLLRQEIYKKLRYHFQFSNELELFSGTNDHGTLKFSLNLYGGNQDDISFLGINNLFSPKTIDESFDQSPASEVPGIKNSQDNWDLTGHLQRVIKINLDRLQLFSKLYDSDNLSALEARLPALHAENLVSALEKISHQPLRLGSLKGRYFATQHWNETNAEKDGTMQSHNDFVKDSNAVILSGPHFYVANPLNKTPRFPYKSRSDYDSIDLIEIPDNYLPRTNYIPACAAEEYFARTPKVSWNSKLATQFYRLAARAMMRSGAEKTYIASIIPKDFAHINSIQSVAFENTSNLIQATCFGISLIADFFIKTTGRSNLHYTWETFPLINCAPPLEVRTLALNCLTTHYTDLWSDCWNPTFQQDTWSKPNDPRLDPHFFRNLTPQWQRHCALRTDYALRQALVEIDVLAAMALGLTLDELITIYRVQFPVMQQYERETYYDQNGRIVFTTSKGLVGTPDCRRARNREDCDRG
jgi:hypothetical protein